MLIIGFILLVLIKKDAVSILNNSELGNKGVL